MSPFQPTGVPYITWRDFPERNERIYTHPGCDGARMGARWMVPLDDCPPPSGTEECANCAAVLAVRPFGFAAAEGVHDAERGDHQLLPGIGHPESNWNYGPPPGLESQVGSLEVEILLDEGVGANVVFSRWLPDHRQREMLLNGAHVRLGVWQHPIPPLAVSVEGPPCDECKREMVWDDRFGAFTCPHVDDADGGPGMGGV